MWRRFKGESREPMQPDLVGDGGEEATIPAFPQSGHVNSDFQNNGLQNVSGTYSPIAERPGDSRACKSWEYASMPKPERRPAWRYWESLSDELLLDVDLTTDSPQSLPDLVIVLPEGDQEPHVEYKYDLRGTDSDKLRCVHCHQPHLASYVMLKNGFRFFVGHICGAHIYGEDFEQYTADYNAAVNRQQALRRKREIDNATKPFMAWLQEFAQSDIFDRRDSVLAQFHDRMPWIVENLDVASHLDERVTKVKLPRTLFREETDPRGDLSKIAAEFMGFVMRLVADPELKQHSIHNIRQRFEALLRRVEAVMEQLQEVEDFFQPAVLQVICDLANKNDNPKKRKYEPGMLSISCKRDKSKAATVHLPRSFRLPDRKAIERFRAALLGISDPT